MTSLRFNTSNFPDWVGFDSIFNEIDRTLGRNSAQTYPPHNLLKVSDDTYIIELAVAGFSMEDLDIETKPGQLEITGDKAGSGDVEYEYVHHGISNRKFKRNFQLADNVYVDGASLVNGILQVVLKVHVPEEMKPRKVLIQDQPQLLLES